MNFFKSVFSDEPDSPTSPTSNPDSSPPSSSTPTQTQPTTSDPDQTDPPPIWTLGGLIKPSWIQTYSRDISEFGSGLKQETQFLQEVASNSLEIGAEKAQVSLESVGQALDSIGFVMSDIIKDSFFTTNNNIIANHNYNPNSSNNNLQKYSRFDAQLRTIQFDVTTYVEDPGDAADYESWLSGFDLEAKGEEIEGLLRENEAVGGFYKRIVEDSDGDGVDDGVFWRRYFYRVHRVKLAENARAELVKRAMETRDEEDLTWDVGDDDEEDEEKKDGGSGGDHSSNVGPRECKVVGDNAIENVAGKSSEMSECGKESDISVVSTQPSIEEDEMMGWDEIEDIGSGDERKDTTRSRRSPNREELRRRFSTVTADEDEDEDLSWDIEDDD